MTQKDKELLLKDLSARLKYGVYIRHGINGKSILTGIERKKHPKRWIIIAEGPGFYLNDIKPYLRPMSSMTEGEKEELSHLLPKDWSVEIDKLNNFYFDMSPSILMEIDVFLDIIDWLNAHHFDYRGLIERGLAIEVTEENNPYVHRTYADMMKTEEKQ